MKKIAIAGASVALAAMPVVGVFADPTPSTQTTTQEDTIQITIDSVCSIGYDTDTSTASSPIEVTGVAHNPGSGSWGSGATADTLSSTMIPETDTQNLGTTTLGIYCNDEDGYTITTSGAAALSNANLSDNIPINGSFSASSTGWSYKVAAASGNRGAVRSEESHNHTVWATSSNANEMIASLSNSTTANAGDFYTVTYGVGIYNDVGAGTYSNTITYTLANVQ